MARPGEGQGFQAPIIRPINIVYQRISGTIYGGSALSILGIRTIKSVKVSVLEKYIIPNISLSSSTFRDNPPSNGLLHLRHVRAKVYPCYFSHHFHSPRSLHP